MAIALQIFLSLVLGVLADSVKVQVDCPILYSRLVLNREDRARLHSLIREFRRNPANPTPLKLVMDLLEETGSASPERIQFARDQIELEEIYQRHQMRDRSQLPETDRKRANELHSRSNHLLDRYEKNWVPKVKGVHFKFQAGVIQYAEINLGEFLGKAKGLDAEEKVRRLFNVVKTLRRVKLSNVQAEDLQAFANTPAVSLLRDLDLSGNGVIGPEAARIIARSPNLKGLQVLDLSGGRGIGDEGIRYLTDEKSQLKLSQLIVSRSRIGPEGALALASRASPLKLTVLNIGHNPIGNQGLATLADPRSSLGTLIDLNISGSGINQEGINVLLPPNTGLNSLQYLAYPWRDLTAQQLERLESSVVITPY